VRLKEKVAIITGSACGIGEAIAKSFAQEGAFLMINDLDKSILSLEKKLKSDQIRVISYIGDVSDYASVETMVNKTLDFYGKVDILINTVALPHRKNIMETSIAEFEKIINVNLKAAFFPAKAILPHMIKRRYGRIVNISSIAGRRGGGMLGKSTYAASKAGVIGLTKGIAREVAQYGITVNTIAPGLTDTPRNAATSPSKIKQCIKNIPLGRMGLPNDIAPAAVYLASDEASFVTGVVLEIDGGTTMY